MKQNDHPKVAACLAPDIGKQPTLSFGSPAFRNALDHDAIGHFFRFARIDPFDLTRQPLGLRLAIRVDENRAPKPVLNLNSILGHSRFPLSKWWMCKHILSRMSTEAIEGETDEH